MFKEVTKMSVLFVPLARHAERSGEPIAKNARTGRRLAFFWSRLRSMKIVMGHQNNDLHFLFCPNIWLQKGSMLCGR